MSGSRSLELLVKKLKGFQTSCCRRWYLLRAFSTGQWHALLFWKLFPTNHALCFSKGFAVNSVSWTLSSESKSRLSIYWTIIMPTHQLSCMISLSVATNFLDKLSLDKELQTRIWRSRRFLGFPGTFENEPHWQMKQPGGTYCDG